MSADHVERVQAFLDAWNHLHANNHLVSTSPWPNDADRKSLTAADLAAVLEELKQLRKRLSDSAEVVARQYAWADKRGRYLQATERDARLIAEFDPARWVEKRVAFYGEWTRDDVPQQPEHDGSAT